MQTPPQLDGLPFWAQILITVILGVGTLGVALRGYLIKDRPAMTADSPATARILGTMVADMGAVRNLTDSVVRLDATVVNLIRVIEEQTHHERNSLDIGRETCARLRELNEELVRQGRAVAAQYRLETKRDERDESRRR